MAVKSPKSELEKRIRRLEERRTDESCGGCVPAASQDIPNSARCNCNAAKSGLSFLRSMNPLGGRFSHRHEPTAEAVFSPP